MSVDGEVGGRGGGSGTRDVTRALPRPPAGVLQRIEALGRRRERLVAAAGLLLIGVALLDGLTGPDLGLSIFYLLPVSLVAWLAGTRLAVLFALLSAAAWLGADLSAGARYSHGLIPYWNALVRLGFFVIVAVLLTAVRRNYEASEVRGRSLEAINEVARAILEERDADETLELVATRARDLAGADFASISVPDSDGELLVRVAIGVGAVTQAGARFPAEGSITGEVIRDRRPIVVVDAALDRRTQQPIVRAGSLGPAVFLPLAAGERVFGTLAVANARGGRGFGEQALTVLRAFAAEAAIALGYAEIREELRRLAVLEDRERIAQELHDGVVQSLFAVGMTLQAASATDDTDAVKSRLQQVLDEIDRVIRDVRTYIFGLRPRLLTHHELERALRDLVGGFGQADRVFLQIAIEPESAARLGARSGDLLQAAREALSNATRHSGAERVTVALKQSGATLVLEVEDDGVGFDPDGDTGKGQGLSNLHARADAVGGRLEIDSAPGRGSRVRLSVPL